MEIVRVFADSRTCGPYKSVKRSFCTALKKACICNFRFYDRRHTFSSHLVMVGVDLTSAKELLGHKDIKMILRYSHLSPGHKRKAVNVLDNVLKNAGKRTSLHSFSSQFGHNSQNDTVSSCAPVAQMDRATVS